MKKLLSCCAAMVLCLSGCCYAKAGQCPKADKPKRPDFVKIQAELKAKEPAKYEKIMATAQTDIFAASRQMAKLAKENNMLPKRDKKFRKGRPCPAKAAECRKADDKKCPPKDCKIKDKCSKEGKEKAEKAKARRAEFAKAIKAHKELREKYSAEMLEIDKKFIAAEDAMYALAESKGIELPRKKFDIRRLRVAFPEEVKAIEAKRGKVPPKELFKEMMELNKKLQK